MIQILIIDDHPLVADGIATMIRGEDYLQITGRCKTGREAMVFLEEHAPDIILLDLSLPDINGLDLLVQIKQINSSAKIIAITSVNETGIITQMLHKGGDGYLLKDMERDDLITAVNTVLNGKIYLSRSAREKIMEQFHTIRAPLNSIPELTRREKQILKMLYEGYNVPQIAGEIFLSPYTIETHKKNLMQKLKAATTPQLLKIARENGLVG